MRTMFEAKCAPRVSVLQGVGSPVQEDVPRLKGFSVKLHMQRLIDFMGDESVWKTMVPGVVIRRRFSRHAQSYPTAYFVDSHWTSRKANSSELFDPYDHYQKPGTHKFCQTFAMMHLLGALPPPVYDYKTYDMYARQFIKKVLDRLPNDHPVFSWDSQRNVRTSLGASFQNVTGSVSYNSNRRVLSS